jgi:hypothetical protein
MPIMDERYDRGWNDTVLWIIRMTADFGRKEEAIKHELLFAGKKADTCDENRGVRDACQTYLDTETVQTRGKLQFSD